MNFSPKKLKTKIISKGFRGVFFGSIFLATLVSAGFLALSNARAAAGINEQISFQGKVVNSDGTNVTDGSYTFLFCLYTTGSPSSNCTTGSNNDAVWRESKSVTVTDGIFQTNLGDTTTLPGSVDFNTDNIYLGINFNSDGQMSPLVRFTAAPYAMNAARVGGLTVTDTTGTLTIPNSETISFGGSFTTSASNDVTLTTTGATNVTLPTTGTLVTLDGVETLTNKTIGSTGLTFSGATTDITTASGEALTLNSGTTGTINIGTDASAETINIGNTGAAVKTIAIGNNTQANTITIGDASVTSLSLTDNNWSISTVGAAAFASLSSSGAIAANGGITFDASTDTVGAFTAAGTIDMSTNTLTNIGNAGTDFVASTGALTLAGVLTANGGISLSGSQSLAAAALSYIDLGLITHSSTANQGLRLPNAASASPSNPTSGEGYLAWDAAGNQLIAYNGSAWTTVGGGSQTPWTSDISAAGYDLGSLSNLGFQETTGAPTGTDVGFYRDNAGDLTTNVLTSKTFNIAVNGTDEYSFSSTGFAMNSNVITGAASYNGLVITADTGTITTGVWNGTAIGAQYGGTGINTAASTGIPTISSGTWSVASQLGVALGGTNATSIGSAGSIAYSTGTAYAFSAVGTAGQALVSGGTGAPTWFAPTAGSVIFAGTSGILQQDNANFFWNDTTNRLGLGTTSPSSMLDILGTSNALRLSYDVSNYATLSTASDGTLSLTSSNVSESQFIIGTGASVDDSIAFDGASQDYYAGLDHTTGYFTIGTGFTVGSSTLFAIDATGNIGIGTGVTAPGARLDLAYTSTNATAGTEYGQRNIISDTGVVTTGTDTTYGSSTAVTRTGATGGTINTYGLNILATTDNAGAGTSTAYGALINTGTSGATNADTVYGMRIETEANTSTTAYGLYVDAGTQAGTEYSAVFMNGSVGVGDATPDALLDFDFTQTSGTLLGISAPASVTLAGLLTGISEDFTNNLTATNQSVTGFATVLPTVTNTGAGSYRYTGFEVYGGDLTQNTGAGQTRFYGTYVANPAITQTTGVTSADGYYVATGINTTGGIQQGVDIDAVGVSAGTLNAVNISAITGGAGTETALNIGSGWDTILDTASLDITGAGAITGATGVSSTTGTFSSTLAANGGITFDASTDTVGAFTSAGTINMSTNILENIGNAGTDFVATTGALTLAGVLTANGGITLASSQIFTASSLSYLDLGAITHGTTAVQGLRLPQAASASPSSPSSGEGYLAWDAGGNQLIYYNGSAWVTVGGGSSDLQTTYGNDVDGGNVTISLTADDDGLVFTNPTSGGNNLSTFLLQLDQANTTANMLALDIIQSSNASNAVNVTANAIDTESGLAITTNGLTAGSALTVTSSATNFSGNLAGISFTGSNVNNTGNVLAVSNTGTLNTNVTLFVDHQATGTNNLAVRVNDVSGDTTPFVIDGAGNVGIGTSAPARILDIVQSASAPQLRLSKDLTYYSEMTVDSAGDLLIGATGSDIRALSENLWVCDNDACPALTLTGDGNIFVENVVKFGNGVYMKNDSATELGVYDNDDQAMLIFDEL